MNSKLDWYRRTTWTTADEQEFFAKLKRAREWSRPQYLKIQASCLSAGAKPALLDAAESLIAKLLADYPDDKSERSAGLSILGDIYRQRQQFDDAMTYYKKAIDFEKEYPNVQGPAFLYFSELAVKLDKREYFPFVEELLSGRVEHNPFPMYKYKIYAVLSIINKINGRVEKAAQFAALADQFAAAETSGLRYHPTLGVVTRRDQELDHLMKNE
jgi:tetratricopeptide (TPR) repeat protein